MTARLVGFVALLTLAACAEAEHGRVPTELQGLWATTDARFAERSFELGPDQIVFHTGGGQRTEHVIEDVQEALEERGRQFDVGYAGDDGTTLRFVFYVDPQFSRIRIRYQEDTAWERVGEASVP